MAEHQNGAQGRMRALRNHLAFVHVDVPTQNDDLFMFHSV